jgi:hypothetical protein
MREWGACLVVLGALLALALPAGAADAPAPSSVLGTGSGHFIETGGPFELGVRARGKGPLAQGYVHGSSDYVGEFQAEGPVTCMLVVGNRASIKYRFRRAEGPGAPQQNGGVQVYIEDNGKPRNGQPVDRVATELPQPPELFDPAAGVCTDPTLNPAWNRIESGDYTVRGAG